jgi:dipeptidyl-peptidase-4
MNYNKYKYLLLTGLIACSFPALAQKKQFTIAEATNGMTTTLAPQTVKSPVWQPDTDILWQAEKRDGKDVWTVIDFGSKQKATKVVEQGTYPEEVKAIPTLKWLDKNTAYFINGKHVILGTREDDKFTWTLFAKLADSAENITVAPSKLIAYTLGNNIWYNGVGQSKNGLSNDKDKNIINGKPVHRDEFGIDRGIFFSPSGLSLAYYRMDQTMVNDYPIVKWNEVPAKADIVKYPMAGGTSHQVTLCVSKLNSGKVVTMKTGEPKDHYLTSVTWSPDEKFIFIAILNREQNHLWLNKYDAETGELVKTLFEETDSKYVHPTHPLSFIPGKNNEFLWWSERDGYNHLYRYNTDGKLIRQVTKGNWVVNDIAGFTSDGKNVIITSSKESPLEKDIYRVDLNKDKMERVTADHGTHTALASSDGKYVLDMYSSAGIPKSCLVRSTNSSYTKELIRAEDPLAAYDRPVIKNVTITAADGVTPLYGKLILPTNFDSTKKYPVIVYLYNGPNVQQLHNSFPGSGNLWYEYMAQHGYIVFTMDGRGSWNRGKDFEQATFRHLGDVEVADQLKGVDYLKSLPYVDANRMGVHGWSYGGFMTTSLMLKHPGVFKCAVAGGPVMDWKMYEVMYTERYMDTPQENPEGYENANLLTKVKNLKGKLLLIHGTNDDVVVWQQSISFIKKCVDEGVQVDYFVYPGHEHNVRGKDRAHLMTKVSDYFDLYLKP